MAHALRLAERGRFTARPNPVVGCVLAHAERVVGEGWHERAGGAHAEVMALQMAGAQARAATAYVTLEPCAHFGRTPPCADALIAAGVARVVIAQRDPFEHVDGRGIDKLRAAGISVECGLLSEQARELNRGFLQRIQHGRPWLRLKLAMSLDGRTALANGESKWITGAAARADVQRWRARSGAILTGSGTVLADNPQLTLRVAESPDVGGALAPLRVVLDSRLQTPAGAHVLDGSTPTLLLHAATSAADEPRFARAERAVVEIGEGGLDLHAVLGLLAQRGINEVQVEAGPVLCGALFAVGLVDEVLLYVAPVFLGDAARPLLALPSLSDMQERWRLRVIEQRHVGDDWRIVLRPAEHE
ncbi:MAG: bifunctional diaminohydroxyphosphoribosylaminopyrimidine deaminase/5-amino-6-(5-phosphoribosylamino)uracil reductase RibD [Dokdonella sp.]